MTTLMMGKTLLYIIEQFSLAYSGMDRIKVNDFQHFGVYMLYSLCIRNVGVSGPLINCTNLSTKTIYC